MTKSEKTWAVGLTVFALIGIVSIYVSETTAEAALSESQRIRVVDVQKMLGAVERGDFIQLTDHRLLMVTASNNGRCCGAFVIDGMGGQSRDYDFSFLRRKLEIERTITPADRDYAVTLTAFVRE